ncbi:ABC transporter ATP-binding protein [Sciscionella sediminilitoris]|uniref:ABC transporter ATP-binding protein n=1 Tax=Sciscionella sediminilitoris TaxID=1445613 RepID=UPI0004DF4A73|nr:ABC transporter ATP-binding protein [Sciscionella sp. SE31]
MASGSELLRENVAGQRKLLAASSTLAAVHQGGEALVPVLIGVIIDSAIASGSAGALLVWVLVLAADFAMLSTAYRFSARFAERANQRAAHELRMRVTERVLDPRGGAESARLPGELVNIATGDARRVGKLQFAIPYGLCASLAGVLVSAIALLRLSIPLGLTVLLGAPLIVFGAQLIGKPLERRSDAEQDEAAFASGVAADLVSGLRVLKGIGAERPANARYHARSRSSLTATLRAARAQAWHDATILILTGLFIAAVALVGVLLAMRGSLGIGGLVAAIGLAQYLLGPFQAFGRLNGLLAQARASAGRIAAVLDTPHAVPGGERAPAEPVRGALSLRTVHCGRLSGVDIEVPAGALLGIVCREPDAATTLAELFGRARDPESGQVYLDGVPLTELDPALLRTGVLSAAHDAELFSGTLAENVSAAADGAIEPALRAAGAEEVAATLAQGTATRIAERGGSLSGGQRQRVALARALAAEPPVLIVHDPTTAVDTVTEAQIARSLREYRDGRTTILLTTSPALLAETESVVFLADGTVTARGSHAQLVHENADYRTAVLS